MAKRLGSGEYEEADVEVKQSELEARYLFLKSLKAIRSHWAFDLLGLFNRDERLNEFLKADQVDSTIHFFLAFLLNKNPHDKTISPEIIDTPLINYYRFFFDKKEELKRLEDEENAQQTYESDNSRRKRNALKKIIPSWKELKERKDAKALCKSLQNWADRYNLNEDWILDFALGVLRAFKVEFDYGIKNFVWENTGVNELCSQRVIYEMEIGDSVNTAISDYRNDEVEKYGWAGLEDLDKFPAFEYRWKDFELQPLTLLGRLGSRKEFVEEIYEKLQRQVDDLRGWNELWGYRNNEQLNRLMENKRKYLESYCNYIEKQKSENVDESDFPPVGFEPIRYLVWLPSKQCRMQFLEKTLAELKTQVIKNQKALESYETFTKRHFNAELKKYFNKIRNSLPENWVKTPLKYSEEKHFQWLVDFQVAPTKTYMEIAKNNNADIKTVRDAVKKSAQAVGISLRQPPIGRPKGSKDSELSPRQLKS